MTAIHMRHIGIVDTEQRRKPAPAAAPPFSPVPKRTTARPAPPAQPAPARADHGVRKEHKARAASAQATGARTLRDQRSALTNDAAREEHFARQKPANDGLDPLPWRDFLPREGGEALDAVDERAAGHIRATVFSSGCDGEFDCDALADQLIPMTENDGIFEVQMPGGVTLGVVVNTQPGAVSFLLHSTNQKMVLKLRERKMELESRVERRIRRHVAIAVL